MRPDTPQAHLEQSAAPDLAFASGPRAPLAHHPAPASHAGGADLGASAAPGVLGAPGGLLAFARSGASARDDALAALGALRASFFAGSRPAQKAALLCADRMHPRPEADGAAVALQPSLLRPSPLAPSDAPMPRPAPASGARGAPGAIGAIGEAVRSPAPIPATARALGRERIWLSPLSRPSGKLRLASIAGPRESETLEALFGRAAGQGDRVRAKAAAQPDRASRATGEATAAGGAPGEAQSLEAEFDAALARHKAPGGAWSAPGLAALLLDCPPAALARALVARPRDARELAFGACKLGQEGMVDALLAAGLTRAPGMAGGALPLRWAIEGMLRALSREAEAGPVVAGRFEGPAARLVERLLADYRHACPLADAGLLLAALGLPRRLSAEAFTALYGFETWNRDLIAALLAAGVAPDGALGSQGSAAALAANGMKNIAGKLRGAEGAQVALVLRHAQALLPLSGASAPAGGADRRGPGARSGQGDGEADRLAALDGFDQAFWALRSASGEPWDGAALDALRSLCPARALRLATPERHWEMAEVLRAACACGRAALVSILTNTDAGECFLGGHQALHWALYAQASAFAGLRAGDAAHHIPAGARLRRLGSDRERMPVEALLETLRSRGEQEDADLLRAALLCLRDVSAEAWAKLPGLDRWHRRLVEDLFAAGIDPASRQADGTPAIDLAVESLRRVIEDAEGAARPGAQSGLTLAEELGEHARCMARAEAFDREDDGEEDGRSR